MARNIHYVTSRTGGLLRSDGTAAMRGRVWPAGANSIHDNVPAVRAISFARIFPKLAIKLARIPAMFGGAMVAGLAYIQYQANRMSFHLLMTRTIADCLFLPEAGNYALDLFNRASETASDAASSLSQGLQDIADQTQRGWQKAKEDIELPEWLQKMLRVDEAQNDNSEGGGAGGRGSPQNKKAAATAGAASVFGYSDDGQEVQAAEDDQMMLLTRKMIEIRNILQVVGQSKTLSLPSIVVIGSQSSGKSSVLEAIVGHEFLPKGFNMVTRRPIELTLVNTPKGQAEYGEFPALGLGRITDFSQVQQTLTDLNLAVPDSDCVSDDPIRLTIHSPHVPDLSLIDLPGYIQVAGRDQPPQLKQKISDLCDKYIQAPNVVLAISAADVDLANSTALRASRRVDPRGERTIGVITKMDLIEPERASAMLSDQKYPLRLGYVGVISRIPQTTALFSRSSTGNITDSILKNEQAYFSAFPAEFGKESKVAVGVATLQKKLMHVLEHTMAYSLTGTRDAISQELEEATYEFKVQYNDRPLSAESYLAESLDSFKHSFKAMAENFGRPQVRDILKDELDQRVMDVLAQRYWNKPIDDLTTAPPEPDPLASLPKADPDSQYWHRKLDASTSALTKLGIGRMATTVVANALQKHIEHLLASSTFASHPYAQAQIVDACNSILDDRFFSTSDQVENCIKPYKYEIEVEDPEWSKARENVSRVLKEELRACELALKRVEEGVGRRKLGDIMSFVEKVRKGDVVLEGDGTSGAGEFSSALLRKGRSLFPTQESDVNIYTKLKTRP